MLRFVALTLLVAAATTGNPLPEAATPSNNPKEQFLLLPRRQTQSDDQKQQLSTPSVPQNPQYQTPIPQKQQPQPQQVQPQQPQGIPERQAYAEILPQQPYSPNLPFDLTFLEPQFQQYPGYNLVPNKEPFPRVQPQILLYGPGGQGQHFLLQPGSPPPHNFLVPQPQPHPGPNVILRDVPQRPVFVAGYPKPAHIPPIEKDAEEIPTNPARIPPLASGGRKPEKLETFNEGSNEIPQKPLATEADVLAAADRTPNFNQKSLRPGQRFFILNGQQLFSQYPHPHFANYQPNLKYSQNPINPVSAYPQNSPSFLSQQYAQPQKSELDENLLPVQSLLLRNAVTGHISDIDQSQYNFRPQNEPQNVIGLNQPQPYPQEALFRTSLPVDVASTKDNIAEPPELRFNDYRDFGNFFQFQRDLENDAVVIDAKFQDDAPASTTSEIDGVRDDRVTEPSVAQAQPGAVALAGPGGTAGAAPRGTALVGRGGLAVSSPRATAVAGATRRDEEKVKKPPKKN